jgi:hypothetical protein
VRCPVRWRRQQRTLIAVSEARRPRGSFCQLCLDQPKAGPSFFWLTHGALAGIVKRACLCGDPDRHIWVARAVPRFQPGYLESTGPRVSLVIPAFAFSTFLSQARAI